MATTIKGIDVSKHQGNIDWRKVANTGAVKFALIRLGYRGYGNGSLQLDPCFHANMQGAAAQDIPTGVYFFSQAINAAEGEEEARFCIEQLKNYKPLYPIYFDAEYSSNEKTGRADWITKEARTAAAQAFCKTLEAAGYYAGIYTFTSFAQEGKLDYAALAESYTMWLADWRSNYDKTLRRAIHQYTNVGTVDGIAGGVDMNTCTVDFPTIIKANGLNGWNPPTAPTESTETALGEMIPIEKYNALQVKFDALEAEHKALINAIAALVEKYGGCIRWGLRI